MNYRNKKTGTHYLNATQSHVTGMVSVTTQDRRTFLVPADDVEVIEATRQVNLFTGETPADKKFREFHEKNPQVFKQLVEMTRQLKNLGHKRAGLQMMFEVLRWRTMLKTTDTDFKLNNNYAGRYARMIMEKHPEFEGFFEIRQLRS